MKDTYSVKELMDRYECARSTIFRMMKEDGFPRGGRRKTRSLSISGAEVYDWELKFMPWLHPKDGDERPARMEEDQKWNKAIAEHEGRVASWRKKDQALPPKKGWDEVRRDIKKKGALERHGKRP